MQELKPLNTDCAIEEEQYQRLRAMPLAEDDNLRLLHNQLLLISQQLAPLHKLASRLAVQ